MSLLVLATLLWAACTWNWPKYSECGNGVVEPGEVCDGADFGGLRCPDLTPYEHGTLICTDSCRIDSTECHDCGNGVLEGSEPCDGSNLDGQSCLGLGFDGGHLGCTPDCNDFDWNLCVGCGDGRLQTGEACDDGNFAAGDGCSDDCQVEPGWDCDDELPSTCTSTCGDGLAVGDEACDGDDLRDRTCSDSGFTGGSLQCLADCAGFDTSGCGGAGCGNGVIEGDEACDDGALVDGDGCSSSCEVEPGWICDGQSPTHCQSPCGDGVCDVGVGETVAGCAADCAYVQISAGDEHTCAIRVDGSVWCWGSNESCMLGVPPAGGDFSTPQPVAGLPGAAQKVVTGAEHSCALLADTTLWCWGNNGYGQLGTTSTTADQCAPLHVTGLTGVVSIAAGGWWGHTTCAALATGTAWCWGDGGEGQIGDGNADTDMSAVPLQVAGLTNVTAVATGGEHTCALLANGTVYCWGLVETGQIGDGTFTGPDSCWSGGCHRTPQPVSGLNGAVALAVGDAHNCAATAASTWCWGSNSSGALGTGSTTGPEDCAGEECSTVPIEVTGQPTFSALSLGGGFSCALSSSQQVSCWGRNYHGELGNSSLGYREPSPNQASTPVGVGVLAVDAGSEHACAVLADGTAWCWGGNDHGKLGIGTSSGEEHDPVQVVEP